MQLKFSYHGEEIKCENNNDCETPFCCRDLLLKVFLSFVSPQLAPVINRIFEVQELFLLADVISQGENQLHHVIKICEYADLINDNALEILGINKEILITAAIFHDVGKGKEIDDSVINLEDAKKVKVPQILRKYMLPSWVDYRVPFHEHIVKGIEIANTYNLENEVLEVIAMHHHVKINPNVLNVISESLKLAPMVVDDIRNYQPEQYAAKGSNLVQTVAILDQLCTFERKFGTSVSLGHEPGKIEDELVKDLVIGVALTDDPRFHILGLEIEENETVMLFDLRAFGTFVQLHSEYHVQALKKNVLNIIRSAVRGQDHREKDLVGLVGGDEFVVITKVKEEKILNKMIERISKMVKTKTEFNFRVGYGIGGSIPENFHEARTASNLKKKPSFIKG